jgi:TonB-dependent receptor
VQPRTRNETNDNLALNFTWGDEALNVRFGALLNDFERERLSFGSSIGPTQGAALAPFGYTGPNALAGFDLTGYARPVPVHYGKGFSDAAGYSSWATANLGAFKSLMDPSDLDAAANLEYTNSGSFEEKSKSAYIEGNGQFDLGGHQLRANIGLRYVNTDTDFTTFTLRTAPNGALFGLRPADYDKVPSSSSDSRVLPSMNLSFDVTNSVIARLAAARTMTRPDPISMLPLTSFSTTGTVSQGNPDLKPYVSDQLDGGVEWYFAEGAVWGVTGFYKEITGFIETQRGPQPFRNANIPLATITDPTLLSFLPNGLDSIVQFAVPHNREDVTYLKGIELLYQQRLDMILHGLGATINYTRLKSNVGLDAQGLPKVIEGMAKNNYNATVYYEPGTFALRLSYNYRGDYVECRVNCFGVTAPETQYRKAAGYLDLSSSLNFGMLGHQMTLSFEALNLTDEEEYSYFEYQNRTSIYNHPGRQYILGIRGQF